MQADIFQKQCNEAKQKLQEVELANIHASAMQAQLDSTQKILQRQQQLTMSVEASCNHCKAGDQAQIFAGHCKLE